MIGPRRARRRQSSVHCTVRFHAVEITLLMTNVLRLAIVDPDDPKRESVKSMLLGMDMIWLEAECSRYEFFADVVAQTNPDIGLVALDGRSRSGLGPGRRGSAKPRPSATCW